MQTRWRMVGDLRLPWGKAYSVHVVQDSMKQVVAPRQQFDAVCFYRAGDALGCADFTLPALCVMVHRLAAPRSLLAHYLEGIRSYDWTTAPLDTKFCSSSHRRSPIYVSLVALLPSTGVFLFCAHVCPSISTYPIHLSSDTCHSHYVQPQDKRISPSFLRTSLLRCVDIVRCLAICATNLVLFSASQVRQLTSWDGRHFRSTPNAGTEYFRMMKCGRLSLPKP